MKENEMEYKNANSKRNSVCRVAFIVVLCFVSLVISRPAQASDYSVDTYEELKEAVNTINTDATIILSNDIIVPDVLNVADGVNLIIKACDDNTHLISSNGSDYIFYIEGKTTVLFDRINLASSYSGGVIGGSGTVSFVNSTVIPYEEYDINVSKTDDNNDTFPHMDIAGFIITWSGFALSFITIVSSVLAILGIKEVRDLRKTRDEIKKIEDAVKESQSNVREIETKYQESLEDLSTSFKNEARSIMFGTYYYSLGVDSYKRGKYSDSITLLKQSLEYIKDNTEADCLIGRAKTFIGEKEEALICYQNALDKDPTCASAYRGLAAYYRYSDLSKALENAEKAKELAPENTEILNYYGQLLRDDYKPSEALKVFLKSYSIKQHPDTDFFLSILYLSEGSMGRARIHIQDAINGYQKEEVFGAFKPVWIELARWIQALIIDEDASRFDKALEQLRIVNQCIESEKTRTVVKGHVMYVLNALIKDEEYIGASEAIINDRN